MRTHPPTHLIKSSVKIKRWYEERELVHYTCQTFKWVGWWIDIKVGGNIISHSTMASPPTSSLTPPTTTAIRCLKMCWKLIHYMPLNACRLVTFSYFGLHWKHLSGMRSNNTAVGWFSVAINHYYDPYFEIKNTTNYFCCQTVCLFFV